MSPLLQARSLRCRPPAGRMRRPSYMAPRYELWRAGGPEQPTGAALIAPPGARAGIALPDPAPQVARGHRRHAGHAQSGSRLRPGGPRMPAARVRAHPGTQPGALVLAVAAPCGSHATHARRARFSRRRPASDGWIVERRPGSRGPSSRGWTSPPFPTTRSTTRTARRTSRISSSHPAPPANRRAWSSPMPTCSLSRLGDPATSGSRRPIDTPVIPRCTSISRRSTSSAR